MMQKREYLFYDLAWEILHNHSPAVSNIDWRLRLLLDNLNVKRIERKWDGQQSYYALYSSSDSKRASKRIYELYRGGNSEPDEPVKPSIKNPYRGGRVSKVPLGTRERVKQYAKEGYSGRKIASITGLGHKQVRNILKNGNARA